MIPHPAEQKKPAAEDRSTWGDPLCGKNGKWVIMCWAIINFILSEWDKDADVLERSVPLFGRVSLYSNLSGSVSDVLPPDIQHNTFILRDCRVQSSFMSHVYVRN